MQVEIQTEEIGTTKYRIRLRVSRVEYMVRRLIKKMLEAGSFFQSNFWKWAPSAWLILLLRCTHRSIMYNIEH